MLQLPYFYSAGDMFAQYTVDLIYRSWVVIACGLTADDDCGHFMMCELACLDATLSDQSEHHNMIYIFPATYNHDTKDIIDYVNAFVNGYNNVSKTGSCLPGCQNIYKCSVIHATINQFLHILNEFARKQFETPLNKALSLFYDFYKEDKAVVINFLNRTLDAVVDDWEKIKMKVFHNQTLVCSDGLFLSML